MPTPGQTAAKVLLPDIFQNDIIQLPKIPNS